MLTVTIYSYDGVRLPRSFKGKTAEITAWVKKQFAKEADPFRVYVKVSEPSGVFGLSHQWRTAEEAVSLAMVDLQRKKPKKLSTLVAEMQAAEQ